MNTEKQNISKKIMILFIVALLGLFMFLLVSYSPINRIASNINNGNSHKQTFEQPLEIYMNVNTIYYENERILEVSIYNDVTDPKVRYWIVLPNSKWKR